MKLKFYILLIIVINETNLLLGVETRESNFSPGYLLKINTTYENYLSVISLVTSLFHEWTSKKIVIIADQKKHFLLLRNLSQYFMQYLPISHPLNINNLSLFFNKQVNENECVLIWCSRICYNELIIKHLVLNVIKNGQRWFIVTETESQNEEIHHLLRTNLENNHKGVFIANLNDGIRIHEIRRFENEVLYQYNGKIPKHSKSSEVKQGKFSLTRVETLYKKHYSALTFSLPPYVIVENSTIQGGLFYDVLETIAEQLQIKFNYTICSWDQMIYFKNNVTTGNVDIGFPSGMLNFHDISNSDYSEAVAIMYQVVVLKNPLYSIKGNFVSDTYLRPFRVNSQMVNKRKHKLLEFLIMNMFEDLSPNYFNMLLKFYLFILITCFSASLTAIISVVDTRLPFKDLQDLLDDGSYEIYGRDGSSFYDFIKYETTGEYSRVAKVLQPVLLDWTSAEFKDVMFRENIAFIAPHLPIIYHFLKRNSSFVILPKQYFYEFAYFRFPKNSPLAKKVSNYVTRLRTSGILKKLENNYTILWENNQKITIKPSVGLENSISMFFILFIGYFFAFVALLLELYINRK